LTVCNFPMPFVYVKLGIESVRIRTEGSSQNVKSARTAQLHWLKQTLDS
jgi:hypothetical protein